MSTKMVTKKINILLFLKVCPKVAKNREFFNTSIIKYIYYTKNNIIKNNKFFFKYLFLIIKKQTIIKVCFFYQTVLQF